MNVLAQLLKFLSNVGVKNVYGAASDTHNFLVKAIEESEYV